MAEHDRLISVSVLRSTMGTPRPSQPRYLAEASRMWRGVMVAGAAPYRRWVCRQQVQEADTRWWVWWIIRRHSWRQ